MNIEKIINIFSDEEAKKEVLSFIKNTTSSFLLEEMYEEAWELRSQSMQIGEHCGVFSPFEEPVIELLGKILENKNCPLRLIFENDPYKDCTLWGEIFEKSNIDSKRLMQIAKMDKNGLFNIAIGSHKNCTAEIYSIIREHEFTSPDFCFIIISKNLSEEVFELIVNDYAFLSDEIKEECDDTYFERIILECQERFLDRIMQAILEANEEDEDTIKWANDLYKKRMGKSFKVH